LGFAEAAVREYLPRPQPLGFVVCDPPIGRVGVPKIRIPA
jgi:hypothetical protein